MQMMRILLTGANGFIGSQIAASLKQAGYDVVYGVRTKDNSSSEPDDKFIIVDYQKDTDVSCWLPRLDGVDAVINCVGILREGKRGSFDKVHYETPLALFKACQKKGIKKVIQISAVGDPQDTAFISSKYKADAQLQTMDLDWVIIRPSVVYSVRGSYGGTSLIRAMAALPAFLFLAGSGQQKLQPISGQDLGKLVLAALERPEANHQVIEAVGPEPISFKTFLLSIRRWLGVPGPLWIFPVPLIFIKPVALLGQWFGNGPLGMTMYRMLQRGNVGSQGSYERMVAATNVKTESLDSVFSRSPSFVQDRWHARLYFLRPLLQISLGMLWIASGIVGLLLPAKAGMPVIEALGLPLTVTGLTVTVTSILDLVLGLMLLLGFYKKIAASLMLLSVLAYTLLIGFALPELWLEPYGGLLKNIPLIPALLIFLAMDEVR